MNRIALPPLTLSTDLWEELKGSDRPIVVYGMGNGGDKLVSRLAEIGREVADFFASDGFVRGQQFHGKRVLSFSEVKEKYGDFTVLVAFGSTRHEVLETVYGMAKEHSLRIPDMPLAGEDYFTAAFYRRNYDKIRAVYDLLADDASKDLFAAMVRYKLTGEARFLETGVLTGDEQALLGYSRMACAVDVGAYRGDTLREMLLHAPRLKTVFAVEPDEKNYRKLVAYAETVEGREIIPVHAAAYDEETTLAFASSGNRNATLGKIGGNDAATASFEYQLKTVKSLKIDHLVSGRRINYIKYDTEGAELAALEGSRATSVGERPALRISVYHRSEDLFALPLWLYSLVGEDYQYYLRRKPCIPAWECELIAVPKHTLKGEK